MITNPKPHYRIAVPTYSPPAVKYRIARTLRRNGLSDRDLLQYWLNLQHHSEFALVHQAEVLRLKTKQYSGLHQIAQLVRWMHLYNIFADTVWDYSVPF